ncbi:MAG: PAS domain S-box protein, partial [Cyanobacteria bacterium P01_F01_bin.42]
MSPLIVRPEDRLQSVLTQMAQDANLPDVSSSPHKSYFGTNRRSDTALVMAEQRLQGIFTTSDIIRVSAMGLDFAQTTIADVMTSPVWTINESELEELTEVLKRFKRYQIYSAPVVNREGKVLGVTSVTQVEQAIQQQSLLKATSVRPAMLNTAVTATPDDSGVHIAQLMRDRQVDYVVIVQAWDEMNESKPRGIITARDIVQFQTLGLRLNEMRAETLMSQPLMCLQLNDSLWQARHAMQRLHVKRLVVVDERGQLQGTLTENRVLSILGEPTLHKSVDLLKHQISQLWMDRIHLLQRNNKQLTHQVRESNSTLRASREQFRVTFEQAAVGMAHVNLDGSLRLVNQKFCDFLGYSHGELRQRSILEITHPEDHALDAQQLQRLLNQEIESFTREKRCLHANGSVVWVNVSVSLAFNQAGAPDYFISVIENISERKHLETQLRYSEQQMRSVFESMHDIVLMCSLRGNEITDIQLAPTNPQYTDYDLVVKHTCKYLLNSPQGWGKRIQAGLESDKLTEFEYCLSINNREFWFIATVSPMADNTVLWVARDISDRKQAEQALHQEKSLAQVTLRSIGDAVITTDVDGVVTNFNPVAEQLTGWHITEVLGRSLTDVFNIVHEETREPVHNPILSALKDNQIVKLASHTLLLSRDGQEYAIEDSAAPIRDLTGNVIGAVMVFHDVTHARHLTRQLSWQASHDSLTSLLNRNKFDQVLETALQSAQQDHHKHVLCYLDLDQFKIINDTCGHAAGDKLLCQISEQLEQSIRSSDALARLGGDEFAILLHQCPLEQATVIAQQICHTIRNFRFTWAQKTFNVGVSIGIVQIDQNSPRIDKILSAADAACFTAKAKGRNRIQIYHDTDKDLQQQRGQQQWSVRIKQALEDHRLCLYGQPIVHSDITSASPQKACEVLLRMLDPQGQVVT